MKKILILGSGGHAKSCIEILEKCQEYQIIGIINKNNYLNKKKKFLNYPIIGLDKDLKNLSKKYRNILIALGQIKDYQTRLKLYKKLNKLKFKLPRIIAPNSAVSMNSKIGLGTIVMQYAIVNSGTVIGNNCIINNKALIEHDVNIQDNCHISTGAIINGNSVIKKNTFVGSGAIISNNVTVGANSIIGAGVVIKKNVKDYSEIK